MLAVVLTSLLAMPYAPHTEAERARSLVFSSAAFGLWLLSELDDYYHDDDCMLGLVLRNFVSHRAPTDLVAAHSSAAKHIEYYAISQADAARGPRRVVFGVQRHAGSIERDACTAHERRRARRRTCPT